MYKEYFKIDDKIVTVNDNKLEVFKNDSQVLRLLELRNKLEIVDEKISDTEKEIRKTGNESTSDHWLVSTVPSLALEFSILLGISCYLHPEAYIPKAPVFIVGGISLGILTIGNSIINVVSKRRKIKLERNIDNLKKIEFETSNQLNFFDNNITNNSENIEKIDNKILLEKVENELVFLDKAPIDNHEKGLGLKIQVKNM